MAAGRWIKGPDGKFKGSKPSGKKKVKEKGVVKVAGKEYKAVASRNPRTGEREITLLGRRGAGTTIIRRSSPYSSTRTIRGFKKSKREIQDLQRRYPDQSI